MEKGMVKIKASLFIFLFAVSLQMLSAGEAKAASVFNEFTSVDDIIPWSVAVPASTSSGGVLEEAEIAIGAIFNSYHFSKHDNHDYNESQNGLYLNFNRWSVGTYKNSGYNQSVFVTYNPYLYRNKLFKINFVVGAANGYEGWENTVGDYLPIVGVSAQWGILKTVLLPASVAFGLELPLN